MIGKKLFKLFNLPKNTRKFVLTVEVDKPVAIACEYYPDVTVLDVDLVTAEFELVEKRC